MTKKIFSKFAIIGIAVTTIISLMLMTACDDDDDLMEIVSVDNSDINTDDNSIDADDDSTTTPGEAVDLALSVKWASINIGALLPADYGNYYAWGEITTKSSYNEYNSLTYGDSSFGNISGNAKYDAARANWGGSWRMPTEAECQELIDCCTWTQDSLTNSDGEAVSGYKVVGANGNSIFLPNAGYYLESLLYSVDALGYYWSSTPRTVLDNYARSLHFYGCDYYDGNNNHIFYGINYYVEDGGRHYGRSVRPVSD